MPTLHWLTRPTDLHAATQVPYRLLEEDPDLSTGDLDTGNMLIQSDNLEALKALLPFYAGQVKCVFIDPPYNTRKDFEHYDDNLEHAQWLEMIYPRLELLHELMAEEGSIWAIIDDDEGHYLKIIMDEIFGRSNFVANVVWQKKHTRANDARWFSDNHDYIIVHAKNKDEWKLNLLPRSEDHDSGFSNPDDDPRGPWASQPVQVKTPKREYIYPIQNLAGKEFWPPKGRSWQFSKERFDELVTDNRIWFGKSGTNVPRIKKFLSEVQSGITPVTIWPHKEVGHNQEAKEEVKKFNADEVFPTPKPERLIQRILHLATNPGDLVLDSFLGSGTTAAVAHKMGRRYIGIEMGEHAVTHCVPRLNKVIDGEQGGISKSVGWQGGGGFRFYRLGPPVFDEEGHIRADIRFPVLAAHIWFSETGRPWNGDGNSPFLGLHDGRAYALLYNGILGDKRPGRGNVLTRATLAAIRAEIAHEAPVFDGPLTVYGEQSRLKPATLDREGIAFKQTPYDVRSRT